VVTRPWLFQTRHFRRFGHAAIPYAFLATVRPRLTFLVKTAEIMDIWLFSLLKSRQSHYGSLLAYSYMESDVHEVIIITY